MPTYIISLKKGLEKEQYQAAIQHAKDQGGQNIDSYLDGPSPGFSVEFPADAVTTMEKAPHVEAVEQDQMARVN